jgi:hypothetical protein
MAAALNPLRVILSLSTVRVCPQCAPRCLANPSALHCTTNWPTGWFYITTSYKLLAPRDQDRVTLVTLAAVAVFLFVGSINLWRVVDMQQLWCVCVMWLGGGGN